MPLSVLSGRHAARFLEYRSRRRARRLAFFPFPRPIDHQTGEALLRPARIRVERSQPRTVNLQHARIFPRFLRAGVPRENPGWFAVEVRPPEGQRPGAHAVLDLFRQDFSFRRQLPEVRHREKTVEVRRGRTERRREQRRQQKRLLHHV